MELGATVCTPRAPSCAGCPLQHTCAAYKQQQEWAQKRLELAKSAAKGFFSPATASRAYPPAPAGDDDEM
jgi:adenine-specific DNA glycosylase